MEFPVRLLALKGRLGDGKVGMYHALESPVVAS